MSKHIEPVFTAEDGVGIFEGDFAYEVKSRGRIYKKPLKWVCSKLHLPYLKKSKSLNFSTLDSAEKYIRENRPQYSLKDVENAFNKIISKDNYHTQIKFEILHNLNQNGRNLE